ncbi:hypothetical protein HanIR_Chr17g0846751 [Helianthus annuus]|nr:hypothetical protein HanIR_Chr17g0846751 [Helianthus annuus]
MATSTSPAPNTTTRVKDVSAKPLTDVNVEGEMRSITITNHQLFFLTFTQKKKLFFSLFKKKFS